MKRKTDISTKGVGSFPKFQNMLYRGNSCIPTDMLYSGNSRSPWEKCKRFHTQLDAESLYLFCLPPVLSKHVERRRQKSPLIFCDKIRDSLKSKKILKNYIFHFLKKKSLKSSLKPKWDIMGVQFRYGPVDNLESAKIGIRFVPINPIQF